jgi:exonuclease III
MIIFSWNCQRLGNLRVVQDLCRMVKNKNPNLVLFMETKIRKKRLKKIRHRLGFSSLVVVDCVGKGGGFGLLWKENAVVEIQNFSHRHINAIIQGPSLNLKWKLTGFYIWRLQRDIRLGHCYGILPDLILYHGCALATSTKWSMVLKNGEVM